MHARRRSAGQTKQAEEIDEIAFEEAPAAQVIELAT
jgi:hypothetical protein